MARRLQPVLRKMRGELPLCPWRTVLQPLNFRTLKAFPPARKIELLERNANVQKLRFNERHDVWFPRDAAIGDEMWSEYLSVFWDHRANGHRYVTGGTPVKAGDVCLDCGACEGFFVFQALAVGAAQVICIEPNPEMAECLRLTFASEIEQEKIIIRNVGVGAVDGSAAFSADRINPFGGSVDNSLGTQTSVKIETIAKVCAELSLGRVDFIKMDIEGAEVQAVEGALSILRRDRPRLAITTYHRSFHFAVLNSLLRAAGYEKIKPIGGTDRNGGKFRPVMLHARA